jgi:hypothetical protein
MPKISAPTGRPSSVVMNTSEARIVSMPAERCGGWKNASTGESTTTGR